MNKEDLYLRLEKSADADGIKGEIYLTEHPSDMCFRNYPHKNDATIACVCMKGELKGQINLSPVHLKASGLLVVLPEQILQFENPSEDFEGVFIIMTKQFTEKISIAEGFSTFLSIREVPSVTLSQEMMEGVLDYCRMTRRILRRMDDGMNKNSVINHLTIAFFYGMGYYLHKLTEKDKKTRSEIIMEDFLRLIQKHFRQQRNLEFYADKLCLTSKHLSASVKLSTGKSARQWIDDYVILEAKRLLKSTDLPVQQISDELNFPSQSFFGKYFKREVGMSPKQYRINT